MIKFIRSFLKKEDGNALVETAVLFPVFLTLLMGVYDLGNGIVVNQKSITSSQVVGDLLARNRELDMNTVSDIVRAGRMALEPYDTQSYGYDIVSLQFDANGDETILWRVTENMPPNDAAIESAVNILELTSDGLVIVTTAFEYDPVFTEFVTDRIEMREVAFLKGRRSAVINCLDCPGG